MNKQEIQEANNYFFSTFTYSEIWKLLIIIIIFSLILFTIYKVLKKIFYKQNNIILTEFETPKNHRAITIGYIIDKKLHNTDIAGAIVQLYQENYLDIVYEKDSQGFLSKNLIIQNFFPFLIKKNWVIKRTPKKDFDLIKSEQLVLKYLFPKEDNDIYTHKIIKLSDIKYRPENNKIFQEIEKEVIYEIEKFKYKYNNKKISLIKQISKHIIVFSVIFIMTFIFFKVTSFHTFNHISLFLLYILILLLNLYIFFSKINQITTITKDGSDILNKIKGYKLYLKTVFTDRTNFFDILEKERSKLSPDLPYMISFNINHRFDKLVKSLEYKSKEEKEIRYFYRSVIIWPVMIAISLVFAYLYLKYKNIF